MVFSSKIWANFMYILGGWNYFSDVPGPYVNAFAPPPLIPRAYLFGAMPGRPATKLSPDGKFLSFLAPHKGGMNIHVQAVEDALTLEGIKKIKPVTFSNGRGIGGYSWTFQPGILLYVQDENGDENYRLYKADVSTGKNELLTDTQGVKVQFIASHYKHPESHYIGLNNRDSRFHDIYHLNVSSGETSLFLLNQKGFNNFVFDHSFKLRLASKEASNGGMDYFKSEMEPSGRVVNWTFYRHVSFEDSRTTGPARFHASNRKLYWSDSSNNDKASLVLTDFDDPSKNVTIFKPQKADIGGILFHTVDNVPLAVYENYRRPTFHILNDTIREDLEYLDEIAGNDEPKILETSSDFQTWLVAIISDVSTMQYFIYDREKKEARYLYLNPPSPPGFKMSRMHSAEVKTQDGMSQVCFFTLPLEKDPLGTGNPVAPGPMVLNVHGGPWARDSWGLNPEVQLLANRGYAVLQCNFRSSTGFGKKFLNAGNGEWAGKMHTDLIDAVNWAIRRKIADPKRVAIYGASYGGYAALVGLTFTPDVFACGIDQFGPSNLVSMIRAIPPYWHTIRQSTVQRIGGDPETPEGREFLRARSPLFIADRIKKPLLIAQGVNDPRTKKTESDQTYLALKSNLIPVTYLLFPDEGHGFLKPLNILAYYSQAERFLANCLGGRFEPAGPEIVSSSMLIVDKGAL